MMPVRRIFAGLQDWYVRHFVKFRYGGLERREDYLHPAGHVILYWIWSDSNLWAQAPPLAGGVIVNEKRIEDLDTERVDGIIAHELGHRNRKGIFRWLSLPLMLIGITGTLLPWWQAMTAWFGLPCGGWCFFPPVRAPANLVYTTGTSVTFALLFIVVNNIEELGADLYAIGIIGEDGYRKVLDELRLGEEATVRERLWGRLMYPNKSTVFWIHRSLKQNM